MHVLPYAQGIMLGVLVSIHGVVILWTAKIFAAHIQRPEAQESDPKRKSLEVDLEPEVQLYMVQKRKACLSAFAFMFIHVVGALGFTWALSILLWNRQEECNCLIAIALIYLLSLFAWRICVNRSSDTDPRATSRWLSIGYSMMMVMINLHHLEVFPGNVDAHLMHEAAEALRMALTCINLDMPTSLFWNLVCTVSEVLRARYWGGGSDTHLGSDTFLSQSFFELATTACIITFAKVMHVAVASEAYSKAKWCFTQGQQGALQSILDTLSDAVVQLDDQGRIVAGSLKLAAMLLHQNDGRNLKGSAFVDLLSSEQDRKVFRRLMETPKQLAGEMADHLPVKLGDALGQPVHCHMSHASFLDVADHKGHFICLSECSDVEAGKPKLTDVRGDSVGSRASSLMSEHTESRDSMLLPQPTFTTISSGDDGIANAISPPWSATRAETPQVKDLEEVHQELGLRTHRNRMRETGGYCNRTSPDMPRSPFVSKDFLDTFVSKDTDWSLAPSALEGDEAKSECPSAEPTNTSTRQRKESSLIGLTGDWEFTVQEGACCRYHTALCDLVGVAHHMIQHSQCQADPMPKGIPDKAAQPPIAGRSSKHWTDARRGSHKTETDMVLETTGAQLELLQDPASINPETPASLVASPTNFHAAEPISADIGEEHFCGNCELRVMSL